MSESEACDPLSELRRVAHERLGLDPNKATLTCALSRYKAEPGNEFQSLVDAATVQYSWLFRDLEQLQGSVQLIAQQPRSRRPEVWVPGCATGEDVYSLAALCTEANLEARILGTDVNAKALEAARLAKYTGGSIRMVPPAYRSLLEGQGETLQVVEEKRKEARFQQHNLMEPAPRSSREDGLWDLIVCRNVFIYFSEQSISVALSHFRDSLREGGTLILGASDIVRGLPLGLHAEEAGKRVVFRKRHGDFEQPKRQAKPRPAARPAPTKARPAAPPREEATSPPVAPSTENSAEEAEATELFLRGVESFQQGHFPIALTQFRRAHFLAPGLWPACYYLAQSLEMLGCENEARQSYRQLEALLATDPTLPRHLADEYDFLRNDVETLARYKGR